MDKGRWTACCTHSNVGEGCSHHHVEDSRLQLQDVAGRQDDPQRGEDEEEYGREEGQEGLVRRAVLQSVAAVRPAQSHRQSLQTLILTD